MKFKFTYDCQYDNGQPIYRYFKLAFTIALRLGIPVELRKELLIDAEGIPTKDKKYKDRANYLGSLTINGQTYKDVIFVVDGHESKSPSELITFWRKGQPGDQPGSKGGAHPFAELYMGLLQGKTTERKVFGTQDVAALSANYNADRKFNIQAWIVNNVPADPTEPPRATEPLEQPAIENSATSELPPELRLINKWRSDVLRTGVPYTNYEVDACVRNVRWNPVDKRIMLDVHWEDGKYVAVSDFGKFDRYANEADRRDVLAYLEEHDGRASRPRMILTVKGDETRWTLASATMLKRLSHLSSAR